MPVRVLVRDDVIVMDAVLEVDAVRELLNVCDCVEVPDGDVEAVADTLGLGEMEVLGD